jgi:hypothetical protein
MYHQHPYLLKSLEYPNYLSQFLVLLVLITTFEIICLILELYADRVLMNIP